jgi:hypothetical protein
MALHNKIHWDLDGLRRMYEVEQLTVAQIGAILGVSSKAVNKACKRFGLKMRRRGPKNGPAHPGWKGGVTIDKDGYVLRYRPNHPAANSNGYVREHRLVMEAMIGRPLLREEVVHHVDDDPANNRPENLVLFRNNAEHLAATLRGKCPQWTEEGRARICAPRPQTRKASRRSKTPSAPESSEPSGRSTA